MGMPPPSSFSHNHDYMFRVCIPGPLAINNTKWAVRQGHSACWCWASVAIISPLVELGCIRVRVSKVISVGGQMGYIDAVLAVRRANASRKRQAGQHLFLVRPGARKGPLQND